MNREEFIKSKIFEKGYTVKSFAAKIEMPYTTLLSMLNGSIGGAAIDNVIKICNGLGITINDLQAVFSDDFNEKSVILTKEESALIELTRALNEEGREKVLEYVSDLAASGRYKKCASDRLDEEEA